MGGALVLDIVVAFVIKAGMDWWRRRGTARWPVAVGIVDSVEERRWYSVHVVAIAYHFEADGVRWEGSDEVNFFRGESSYEFRRKVHPGMIVRIRVGPREAGKSVLA